MALAVHAMDVVEVQTKIPSWEFSLPFLHYHIRILSATAPVERIDVANGTVQHGPLQSLANFKTET